MRPLPIVGVLLAIAGLYVVFNGLHYSREESVLKIGQFEAKVQEQRTVPEWLGGVALGAGAVLLIMGFKRR